ncbi:ABC transporter substrate-binding protein [Isoptericola sp. b490]|uniref:ABC transporter substrate-binding protein n=1 Tax=Actinotalea lenta TaxID=3064654 RepID=UPI002712BB58|nr:ABC transporter substrate-binding protein [Isoptericola sp. b490]MDO8121292.1 ABC transporter substrate-binding protein [Isoptericola sp. b490]
MKRRLAILAAALTVALAGCSGTAGRPAQDVPSASGGGSAALFPVTVDDAFGTTTVPSAPRRVVTWGRGATDAAIALGVLPVAIPYQPGGAQGVLPWVRDAVEGMGAALPTVLPDTGTSVPYDAIRAARPDLILAPYSGLTEEQDTRLSAIAPVVAYPDQPWSTPWRDIVTITGRALGRPGKAREVLVGIDQEITRAREAHPEFAGLTLAAVQDTGTGLSVYPASAPRMQIMLDLGFRSAPSVQALGTDETASHDTLSHERLAELTSDVLVLYASDAAEAAAFLAAPSSQVMPQVTHGAVAELVGSDVVASVSPPTALSLTWGLDRTVHALAQAAAAAG